MKEKVAVFGTLQFPPDRVAEVLPHLKTLVESTYKYDGCIAYDVAEDPFDLGLIREKLISRKDIANRSL